MGTLPLLTFSFDLELEIEQQGTGLESSLDDVISRLIKLCDRYKIPATWAVADPAISAATHVIRASNLPHEIAVLGERSWVGRGAGRMRFDRELTRRVLSARAMGIPVETLALRHIELDENLDLLSKAGIGVVRAGRAAANGFALQERSSFLRHGVRFVSVAERLPQPNRWWWNPALRSARKALRRSATQSAGTHLVLDAARLVDPRCGGLAGIERLLSRAAKLRDQGRVTLSTLNTSQPTISAHAPTSQSILRRAA